METLELRKKRRADLEAAELKQLQESMTVRERLERKLQTDEVVLKLKDDLGDIGVKFRKLSVAENNELARLLDSVRTEPTKLKETNHAILVIFGGACLDPELNSEYWEAGKGFSGDVLNTAILQLKAASTVPDWKYLEGISSFR